MRLIVGCLLMTVCTVMNGYAKTAKPLKVFILAGQSNATGMVRTNTLEHIKMFPETAKEFADLFDKDGAPVVLDDVYVSQWMDKNSGKLTTAICSVRNSRSESTCTKRCRNPS